MTTATSAASAALTPSTRRAIPLEMRDDLRTRRIEYKGVGSFVIKDPVGLKYHRLQAEQFAVLNLLDGEKSLEAVRDDLRKRFPTLTFTLADVQNLVTDLHEKGLVYSNRPGQGAELIRHDKKERSKKRKQALRNLLYLRLPGWDPHAALEVLYPFCRWLFRPWSVATAVLLVLSALTLLLVQFDTFQSRLPGFQQFFGWPNLMYMWFSLGAAKVIHEFGHGLSCKHFGGECHEMGLMFLVFSPCLYCDVSDSWMLKSKWQRIIIGGAGMYIEVILSAIAIFVWWYTKPGLVNYLALNVFFVTTVTTVIFNANPLMRFDGYYMMSDLLEIPNLRPKADKLVRDSFAWYCLGIETRPDAFMPDTGRFWFGLFAVAAALYRWVILFGITIFLYTWLKPYGLQSIGIMMAVVSIGGILYGMGMNVYRMVSAPRTEPLSKPKMAVSLTLLGGFVAAAFLVPLPLHVESAFVLEPHDVSHVYTLTAGMLVEPPVEPGVEVEQGKVVARLKNEELEDLYKATQIQHAVQKKQVDLQFALDDPAQEYLAREKLKSIEKELADIERQLADLVVRAPASGRVVAPPDVPLQDVNAADDKLPTWSGTPLDRKNVGGFFETRTHLMSIAPRATFNAILLIDQADRNDVRLDQDVELQFDHLPGRIYKAKVLEIADRHSEFAPKSLSNKAGGDLPTVSDSQGRERLASIAYQAKVYVDEDVDLLQPGIRGRARFDVDKRSAAGWAWRYLRRTFHFRL